MFDHPDIKDLVLLLQKHQVKFVLIGGHAVMCYAHPRYTKDIDFLVSIEKSSAEGCIEALIEFGVPADQIDRALFHHEGNFFKVGQEPWRVDLITSVTGLVFSEIFERSVPMVLSGLQINVISKGDLITLKTLAGRPQDLIDIEALKKANS